MLNAAMTFAEALNDANRAEKVADIKSKLEASIGEIVQHQNLLERKLTEQLEDIARRRAELDELERSSIENMLATDKEQRTEVGASLESFLLSSKQVSQTCTCSHRTSFDGVKGDSKAEEKVDDSCKGTSFHASCTVIAPVILYCSPHTFSRTRTGLLGQDE